MGQAGQPVLGVVGVGGRGHRVGARVPAYRGEATAAVVAQGDPDLGHGVATRLTGAMDIGHLPQLVVGVVDRVAGTGRALGVGPKSIFEA